jgi:hypothetical protein
MAGISSEKRICLSTNGRSEQAIASLKRARQNRPSLADHHCGLGFGPAFCAPDPNLAKGHRHLGMAYEQKAMDTESIAE